MTKVMHYVLKDSASNGMFWIPAQAACGDLKHNSLGTKNLKDFLENSLACKRCMTSKTTKYHIRDMAKNA
jgi:hypothetical protein